MVIKNNMLQEIQPDSWYKISEIADNKWIFWLSEREIRVLVDWWELYARNISEGKNRPTYRIKWEDIIKYILSFKK